MQTLSYFIAPLSFFFAGILVAIMAVRKVSGTGSPSFWDYLALLCAMGNGIFFMGLMNY